MDRTPAPVTGTCLQKLCQALLSAKSRCREILDLLRYSAETYGQTIVMVTHDPRGAAIADRILFLADGLIVKELTDASSSDALEVMSTLQS